MTSQGTPPESAATPAGDDARQLDQLRETTEALARNITGTKRRLSVQAGEYRVEVEWEPAPGGTGTGASASTTTSSPSPEAALQEEPAGHAIAAPLVGTFYRAPEPGADPFVSEGGQVEVGQEVCIVEAMKIMNRIESDVAGTVRAILVEDGEVVEYGQPLMIVDTDQGTG